MKKSVVRKAACRGLGRSLATASLVLVFFAGPALATPADDRASHAQAVLSKIGLSAGSVPGLGRAEALPVRPGARPVPAIPEPSAALIFAAGLLIAGYRRRN